MPYDLKLIDDLCQEIGLASKLRSADELAIELERSVILLLLNSVREQDCLITFEGVGSWHAHDDFMFSDRRGFSAEMTYFDVIAGIPSGEILISELWRKGKLEDRWLVHKHYVGEFEYLDKGEEIRVRRAVFDQ